MSWTVIVDSPLKWKDLFDFQLSSVGESTTLSFEIFMIIHVGQLTFKALGGSFRKRETHYPY